MCQRENSITNISYVFKLTLSSGEDLVPEPPHEVEAKSQGQRAVHPTGGRDEAPRVQTDRQAWQR